MIIRKLFKFESSHVVRNCSSERCSRNVHGHSYKVELFLTSTSLDKAGMIVDFGLLTNFKNIVDAFDHSHVIWSKDTPEYKKFFQESNDRWVELSYNPSAEIFSLIFFYLFDNILSHTIFANGEGHVKISGVRVHETDTGYAECDEKDFLAFKELLRDKTPVKFSPILCRQIPGTATGWTACLLAPERQVEDPQETNRIILRHE